MAEAQQPHLSLVVPAHDEERRLGPSLDALIDFARSQPYAVEIIVVDDGSADATADIAQARARSAPAGVELRLLRHQVNQGKGAAVRTGCLAAQGDFVVFLDADLATPPEEALKLLSLLEGDADVAIGSRVQPGGHDMRVSQPPHRRAMGALFTLARKALVASDIQDTQCPLKGFRREAAQRIFEQVRLSGWAFDVEALYLARKLGYRVREAPVVWRHVGDSRLSVSASTGFQVLRDLLRVRWIHRSRR